MNIKRDGSRDPHIVAEEDSAFGRSKDVASYLRKHAQPNVHVLRNISAYLQGGEDWVLRFTSRNGRPSKKSQNDDPDIWGINKEAALAAALDDICLLWNCEQGLQLDMSVAKRANVQNLLRRLADVMDPDPRLNEKWKLSYGRDRRRGNPKTTLETQLGEVRLGEMAIALKIELGTWSHVDNKLHELGYMGGDNSRRKKAVRLVRQIRARGDAPSVIWVHLK